MHRHVLLAFLAGAALVGAAWWLAGAPGESAPGSTPLPDELGTGGAAVEARLEGIERRLEALLAAAESRTAAPSDEPGLIGIGPGPHEEPTASAATDAGAEAPVITDEVLDRTLERLRERRFAKMTPDQLRAEARRLIRQARDPNGAREVLEHLLGRQLAPDVRAKALTELGSVHRELGDTDASEKALREAMRTAGPSTETGIKAGYHLVWTFSKANQPRKGLALADELLALRDAPTTFRPWIRWARARMAYDSGDTSRALRDYRALIEDLDPDDVHLRQIVADAHDKLEQLDAGPR